MEIIDYKDLQIDSCAVALGKFQGIHKGHMLLINKILELSYEEDITSVVFTINMAEQMLHLPEERFAILEELGVDVACECQFSKAFMSLSPEEFVKEILVKKMNVRYVVVGMDFKFGHKCLGDVDSLREFGLKYGFRVIAFEKLKIDNEIVSSSLLRNLLIEGNVQKLAKLMGRTYSAFGKVIEGKQLGRTIGFPTINLSISDNKLLPMKGVYETEVIIDLTKYKGITNIGYNPTVNQETVIHVETHILDFNKDIYGKIVEIQFVRFIRHEMKFNSLEDLVEQINIDKQTVISHQ